MSQRHHSPRIPQQPLLWEGVCESCAPDLESRPNRASSCQLHRRSSLSACGSHTGVLHTSGIAWGWLFWQWTPDSSEENWFWGLSVLIVVCTPDNWRGLRLVPRKDKDRAYRSCAHSLWWLGLEGNSGRQGRWAPSGRLLGFLSPFSWGKNISLFLFPQDKKGTNKIRLGLWLNNALLKEQKNLDFSLDANGKQKHKESFQELQKIFSVASPTLSIFWPVSLLITGEAQFWWGLVFL